MKNFFYIPFLFLVLFFSTSNVYSQEKTITGFVTTLENIAVVNAEVKVLSSKVTVLTDNVGHFKLNCLPKDKLKISAKGFYSQKIKIDKKTKEAFISMLLKSGEKNLDIAVNYGHIKEKDKSYALSTIKNSKKNKFSRYSNMLDYIANSSPSIVVRGGGIIIRGETSLNGSSYALIILNGTGISASELAMLPPMDVKSVDVLDGASAAGYGSRGANGVVIITTKRGGDKN